KCQVVISDGITLGHPCCGIFQCMEPLQKSQHHFCKSHNHLHDVCAVNACEHLVVEGGQTCGLLAHQTMEALSIAKGKSAFTL
ncbi:hypothetical protein PAXRUDRAFT_91841, partial [Paxillus rubicundulus Ve08.2h10]